MMQATQEQKVICHKCSERFKTSELESHISTCEYSACPHCMEYYPNFLITEHSDVCEDNPDQNEELNEYINNYGQ
jgi:hypothetical protein